METLMRVIYDPDRLHALTATILYGPEDTFAQIRNAFDEINILFGKKKYRPICSVGGAILSPSEIITSLDQDGERALIGAAVSPFMITFDVLRHLQREAFDHLVIDHILRKAIRAGKKKN